MPVPDRQDHRRDAVRVAQIQIGPGVGERSHGVQGALPRREQQRRQTLLGERGQQSLKRQAVLVRPKVRNIPLRGAEELRARVQRGAGMDQRLHDGRVIFGRRPHQGRLTVPPLRRVDVRSVGQEHLNGVDLSRPGRDHQRRLAFRSG